MPRSAGTYTLPVPPFNDGDVITAATTNSNNSDIATALTGSLPRDGTGAMLAALPMGGFKITGAATPTAATDGATKGYVDGLVGVELLGTAAPSGSPTYIEFALPAGYGSFVFDCANVKPNASAPLAFQLSVNGGGSWFTGGSDYSSGATYSLSPFGVANAASAVGLLTVSISNSHACRTMVHLSPAIPAAIGSYYTSVGSGVESATVNYAVWTYGGVSAQGATRPNRIRFFFSGSTFGDIGRILMLGLR
jgi:hypothetical protein